MEAATPGRPGDDVDRAEAAAHEADPTRAATPQEVVQPEGGPDSPRRGESPLDAQMNAALETLDERPELLVAGAFAGGLVLAMLLRALGPSK